MIEWGKTGDEPQRIVQENLLGLENSLKVYRGLQSALLDDRLMDFKTTQERELRARVSSDAKLAQQTGTAWDDIAKAQARYRDIYDRYVYLESGTGFNTELFGYARQLVRGAAERAKPNEQRLREYADSNLSKMSAGLLAATPIYPEFETLTFAFSLDKMRETLGPDDDIVRRLLSKDSPESLAAKLVRETKLADPAVRKALWEGGAAAVAASQDPMIALARSIDADARALRKVYEDEVQARVVASQEKIAKARFAVLGTNVYPDATFTLRLSYGDVRSWIEKGQQVEPFTKLSRLYERTTGAGSIPPAAALAGRAQQARPQHAVQLRDDERHRRRQLRQPRRRRAGPPGRPAVRRQHPLDRRQLLVRRNPEPRRRRASRHHPHSVARRCTAQTRSQTESTGQGVD